MSELVTEVAPADLARAMVMEGDLLPCPFRGCAVLSVGQRNTTTGNFVAKIFCVRCGVSMVVCRAAGEEDLARREVVECWNRRVPP